MNNSHRLSIAPQGFMLDGEPFRFISGAIHYFRVPREYWRDRLLKLKACGFNAVETYVAWNSHEKTRGNFDFEGMLDIGEFLSLAHELGLWAIIRPGPYICSEWEFGGLPWWLLQDDEYPVLRCMNKKYLEAVDSFFDRLMPILAEHQSVNGGNILMMQVENEYGSYGDDREYLKYLADGIKKRGITVPLFTSDGATDLMLSSGTLEGVHKTCNFGSRPDEQFGKLREHQPDGPLMCSEFWNGWFDHWGEQHHTRNPEEVSETLDEMLSSGASVSVYMFHGGTNFGFMNGANCLEKYEPTVSSYDDDAPINENGELTEKYYRFREVVSKYAETPDIIPEPIKKERYGTVELTESASLFDNLDVLSSPVQTVTPVPMEKLGQGYGFILYSKSVRGPRGENPIVIQELHDRAHVFKNGKLLGIQDRNGNGGEIKTDIPSSGIRLDILVENMGRVNYGPHLLDAKGITEGVRLGNTFMYHWDTYPLPLEDISGLRFIKEKPEFDGEPVFLRGVFDTNGEPRDTFVKTEGFKSGIIFVNGKVLGRYRDIGPQHSSYIPAPFLRNGVNEIVLLELDGFEKPEILLDSSSDLG